MKTNKRYFSLLALAAMFSTAAYAGDVVKDTLGTTASSAKTVETLLQGQVAGVRVWSQDGSPMSASGVSIRGVNSLRGGQQPLYIVDGAILNDSNTKNVEPFWQYGDQPSASPLSQLSFLVPGDIESIEILKNASATALYGSKGANGVVIITTKKVKDERSVITLDSNLDIATPLVEKGTGVGISHNHKLMFGGSKNNSTYTLSGYFRDDNYVIPGTGGMKGGLRASFETQANPVVWFGLNSTFTVASTKSASATSWFGSESMTMAMRDPEASIEGWAADYDDHALDYRTVNSMWLQLNLAKGLSFKFDLGADYQYLTRNFWWGNGTSFGLANNGAAAILKTSSFAYNASGVLKYQTYFDEDHHFVASAGVHGIGGWDVFNPLNGTDFYNHSIRYKSLNIAASKAKLNYVNRNIFNLGIFGNVAYDYKGIAGAEVAYRTDFNPEFGTWNMYPSVSAYWDIAKTLFPSNGVVSTLKLDLGYGETGKDEVLPYEYLTYYAPGPYCSIEPNSLPFHDVRNYIHSSEFNASLTYGMFDDRLTLTAGYFRRMTSDNLSVYTIGEKVLTQPDDSSSGEDEEDGEVVFIPEHRYWQFADRQELTSQTTTVSSEGVELELGAIPVQTKDWTWSINANAAYNVSKIHRIHPADMGGMSVGAIEGAPLIATNNYEGFPVSSIVDEDGAVIGNPTPKWYGGLSTSLRWKDLTLDVLADGAAGHQILNLNQMFLDGASRVTGTYVENGDFFRIARVSLSYNIPVKNVKWMESFKVFATASNLATFTSYNGWSPDVNSYAASNFRLGMDYGSYPAARSFVLGLSIKF